MWNWPRSTIVLVALGAVSVSACSETRGGHASTNANGAPAASADVEKPFTVASSANTVLLQGGQIRLAPPRRSDTAGTTAAEAFDRCGGVPGHIRPIAQEVPRPDVQLTRATITDWGQAHANGSVTPIVGDRLVWIIWYKHLATRPGGKPTRNETGVDTAIPRTKTDAMTFVDARTGRCLTSKGFPSAD